MAVIQRSNVIKRQRRKNSWLNEQAFYLIASTRWCSYSCCCRQPVTQLKLSWDAVMCFFSLSPQHPPLHSLSLSQIHSSTCIKMQQTLNTTSRLPPEESECERLLVKLDILREIVKHFNARCSVNQKWLNPTRVFNTASLEKVTGLKWNDRGLKCTHTHTHMQDYSVKWYKHKWDFLCVPNCSVISPAGQ